MYSSREKKVAGSLSSFPSSDFGKVRFHDEPCFSNRSFDSVVIVLVFEEGLLESPFRRSLDVLAHGEERDEGVAQLQAA